MNTLIILGILLLALILIGQIRMKARVEYSQEGLQAAARVGPIRFDLYPRAAPGKKKKRKKPKPKPKPEEEQEKPGGKLGLLLKLIPTACQTADRFRRRLLIEKLYFNLTLPGAEDAAGAAIRYGQLNGVVGGMAALIERSFHVKQRRLRTNVDFTRTEPEVYLRAIVSLTVGQGLTLALWAGLKALRVYLNYRKEQKLSAKAVPAGSRKE